MQDLIDGYPYTFARSDYNKIINKAKMNCNWINNIKGDPFKK